MGRLRSLEKMTPKKAIFSTVLSKIVDYQEINTTINVDGRMVAPHDSAKRLLLF